MTPAEVFAHFHFLRPLWLLSIIPATLLAWLLLRQKGSAASWRGAINETLLHYLSDGLGGRNSRLPFYGLWLGWLVAAVALAGPTWNKLPQPVHQRQDALVIVLDLSLSMLCQDVKPSRLIRARQKILDIIDKRREGLTALVAYSGDAHIVTPLTDDVPTIANLVPALSPLMMPVIGSDPVAAMDKAREVFHNAGVTEGRVLLITDGITDHDVQALGDSLRSHGLQLSVLGVGTLDGAPIPADKGFLKDRNGNIIIPKLNRGPLEKLAANNDGKYTDITLSDKDIRFLLPPLSPGLKDTVLTEREFNQWQDRGPLLAILLIPLAALAFRRGWLLTIMLPLLLMPKQSMAFEWRDLWQRPDQRAAQQLQAGDVADAAKTFKDPAWKGSAQYRAKNYRAAAENFSKLNTADAYYNRGNALAREGKLQQAIAAYDKALKKNPNMGDASFNRSLVRKLLQQQQKQRKHNPQNRQHQKSHSGQKKNSTSGQQHKGQSTQDKTGKGGQQKGQSQKQNGKNADNTAKRKQQQSAKKRQQAKKGQQQQASQAQRKPPRDQQQAAHPADQKKQAADTQSEQRRQAMEQWLRRIPDDPSGLLRRKFKYESRLRQQQGESQREQPQW